MGIMNELGNTNYHGRNQGNYWMGTSNFGYEHADGHPRNMGEKANATSTENLAETKNAPNNDIAHGHGNSLNMRIDNLDNTMPTGNLADTMSNLATWYPTQEQNTVNYSVQPTSDVRRERKILFQMSTSRNHQQSNQKTHLDAATHPEVTTQPIGEKAYISPSHSGQLWLKAHAEAPKKNPDTAAKPTGAKIVTDRRTDYSRQSFHL